MPPHIASIHQIAPAAAYPSTVARAAAGSSPGVAPSTTMS